MADLERFIESARVLRKKGDDLVAEYRASGLTMSLAPSVLAFMEEEATLREGMEAADVNAATVPALMEDMQRIAFIRQDFDELLVRIDAMTRNRLH